MRLGAAGCRASCARHRLEVRSDLLGLARDLGVQAREARGGLEKALELPGRGHPSADLLREDPRDRGEEVRLLCRDDAVIGA